MLYCLLLKFHFFRHPSFFLCCSVFSCTRSIMSSSDPPPLHPDAIIRYDEQWQVSICRPCEIGVNGNTLKFHLTNKRHGYRKRGWGPILDALKDRPQPRSINDFPRPPNGIPPIPDLKIWDGFVCNVCGFIITSEQIMKYQHRKEHKEILKKQQIFYRPVKVQVQQPPYDACKLIRRHGLVVSHRTSGLFQCLNGLLLLQSPFHRPRQTGPSPSHHHRQYRHAGRKSSSGNPNGSRISRPADWPCTMETKRMTPRLG